MRGARKPTGTGCYKPPVPPRKTGDVGRVQSGSQLSTALLVGIGVRMPPCVAV